MTSRVWSVVYRRFSKFVRSHYWKTPRLLFIGTYVSLAHQLCLYAFPGRRRILSEVCVNCGFWVLYTAMIAQANEMWEYLTFFVDRAMVLYKKGEPYHVTFMDVTYMFPLIDPGTFRMCMSMFIACLPYIVTYALVNRQRRFRMGWFTMRNRYRNEIGSSRYYLTHPVNPHQEVPKKTLKKFLSESTVRRTVKEPLKKSRSA